jgi:hypothetical protein
MVERAVHLERVDRLQVSIRAVHHAIVVHCHNAARKCAAAAARRRLGRLHATAEVHRRRRHGRDLSTFTGPAAAHCVSFLVRFPRDASVEAGALRGSGTRVPWWTVAASRAAQHGPRRAHAAFARRPCVCWRGIHGDLVSMRALRLCVRRGPAAAAQWRIFLLCCDCQWVRGCRFSGSGSGRVASPWSFSR